MQCLYHVKYDDNVLHNYILFITILIDHELEISIPREGVARVNYHAIEIESDNLIR